MLHNMVHQLGLVFHCVVLLAEGLQTLHCSVDDQFHGILDVVLHETGKYGDILVLQRDLRHGDALEKAAGGHPKTFTGLALVNVSGDELSQSADDLFNNLLLQQGQVVGCLFLVVTLPEYGHVLASVHQLLLILGK